MSGFFNEVIRLKEKTAINYRILNADNKYFGSLLKLNENEVPNVNSIEMNSLDWFKKESFYFKMAMCDDLCLGFLIALGPNTRYQSQNYKWLQKHYKDFVYIDRIIVRKAAQRQGIASTLYQDLKKQAHGFASCLTCEVNLIPQNIPSMVFHKNLGFKIIGERYIYDGEKKVAYMLMKI